jgi:inositol hexakisphosphate/diphosphoinositol-pentakisphosphate kinase
MLRSNGQTFVCDVNGFSFVKTSDNYYVDCANELKRVIYKKLNLKQDLETVSDRPPSLSLISPE